MTSPPSHASFEDEIARDPDDPAPYLVYADWLLEHGDPRGELIIVQDELARTTDAASQAALRAREQAILDAHLPAWMGGEVRGPRIELSWRRGFLDRLSLDYRGADPGGLPRLLHSPLCRFVRVLELRTHVSDALVALLRSPSVRRLETLNVGSYRSSCYSTHGLAAAFPGLLHLDCDADEVELVDLQFPALRSLGLALVRLTVDNIAAIAAAECPRLESLLIWGGQFSEPPGDDDDEEDSDPAPTFSAWRWRRLLEAEGVPALRILKFDGSSFGDELVEAIADSPLLRQLTYLRLDDTELTVAGYERLLDHAEAFRHLTTLRLRDGAAAAAIKARLVQELGPIVVCKP